MKIHEMFGNTLDRTIYGSDESLVDSDTFLGLELELEGVSGISFHRNLNNYYWDVKTDGSLRNGCELVYKSPIKGANIISSMKDLEDAIVILEGKGKVPNLSERTSMHVHLDVRDLDQERVVELITLYMLFERLLFEYVGPSRIKNNYCRALVDSTFSNILSALVGSSGPAHYMDIIVDSCDKYSALNVKAVHTFGSLEFRHHPGSYKTEEIIPWLNLILSLKRWIKDGNEVSNLMPLSPVEAISDVFGSESDKLLSLDYPDLYNANKGAILKILNVDDLSRGTAILLSKRSRAKNQLINKYEGVV